MGDERRLVTVLSADWEGSTLLGEQLDPEDVRTLQGLYYSAMRRVITPLGGTIEKYIGDEVLAMFGAPVAHEDDAERAVRCALAMRIAFHAVADEAARRWGVVLRLRIGVNTATVVSGAWDAGDHHDYAISGDAVNTVARLQKAAAPGDILAGESTLRLARRGIEFGSRQDLTLKGKSGTVAAYPVLGARPQPAERWERAERLGRLTPLVGREHELATLRGYLAQAGQGHRHVVFVSSEPGIGKTRCCSSCVAWCKRRRKATALGWRRTAPPMACRSLTYQSLSCSSATSASKRATMRRASSNGWARPPPSGPQPPAQPSPISNT
jgi:class 3 adenylate cyclase